MFSQGQNTGTEELGARHVYYRPRCHGIVAVIQLELSRGMRCAVKREIRRHERDDRQINDRSNGNVKGMESVRWKVSFATKEQTRNFIPVHLHSLHSVTTSMAATVKRNCLVCRVNNRRAFYEDTVRLLNAILLALCVSDLCQVFMLLECLG